MEDLTVHVDTRALPVRERVFVATWDVLQHGLVIRTVQLGVIGGIDSICNITCETRTDRPSHTLMS